MVFVFISGKSPKSSQHNFSHNKFHVHIGAIKPSFSNIISSSILRYSGTTGRWLTGPLPTSSATIWPSTNVFTYHLGNLAVQVMLVAVSDLKIHWCLLGIQETSRWGPRPRVSHPCRTMRLRSCRGLPKTCFVVSKRWLHLLLRLSWLRATPAHTHLRSMIKSKTALPVSPNTITFHTRLAGLRHGPKAAPLQCLGGMMREPVHTILQYAGGGRREHHVWIHE